MTGRKKEAEALVQRQVRLLLQQQCFEEFKKLGTQLPRLHYTLLMFDYSADAYSNCAFATTLRIQALVVAFEALTDSWKRGVPRMGRRSPSVPTLSAEEMERLAASVTRPAGVGHALLVGSGALTSYVASAERSGVLTMLETELLPKWREEAARG